MLTLTLTAIHILKRNLGTAVTSRSISDVAGMLWTECKQMYMSGLRVYLLDSYNWIDFIVLSLYLASYVLRFLVSHRVHQADQFYNSITSRSRDALAARDFRLYDVIVNDTFTNRSSSLHNYFMKACKTVSVRVSCLLSQIPFNVKLE